ncbi:MAG: MFS transporter [Gammaproteobacteria bacterium]|nr:MAG: MFS transporter [Gammaproteobacteria bacterium]TLZ01724.1 MAG: MFS transporter [Gammaproteobacteria bacterium]TLZ42037.1 MAG: MFS transporter [Gammaproteobacteria bacterium]
MADRLVSQVLRRLIILQPGEAPALLASFTTLLCMFSSYTILRPVRDALGITSGLENIPYLFWGVFAVMLLLQPLYGWLTSRFPRSVFLPWVYGFFAANLLIFWVWFRVQADHTWIARTYFVWVSVFNLFVVAAFWSLMADVFSREQAGRLFGFIWAGASTGGLIGPFIDRKLAVPLGAVNLLPLSAGLLLVSLLFMAQVIRWQRRQGARAPPPTAAMPDRVVAPGADGALGSGVFAAFVQVVRSPYLLGIAAFVLLMTWVSTFLYLEQQAFVARAFGSADERTRFFAGIDLCVQAASLTIQFLLFGRLFRWLGMRSLLASVPLIMTAGYALFALVPVFAVLVSVYAVRRVADYAITRPCRDSLFTVVSREEKYQAKSLIDTFAYRGGDALSGSLYKGLAGGLGAGPTAIGWLGAGISALWSVLALALGRAFEQRGRSARANP